MSCVTAAGRIPTELVADMALFGTRLSGTATWPVLGACVCMVLGCRASQSTDPAEPSVPPAPPVGVVAIVPNDASIAVGDTIRLRIAYTTLSQVQRVVWRSSDTALATVDSTGLVTGRHAGQVGVAVHLESAQAAVSGAVTIVVH